MIFRLLVIVLVLSLGGLGPAMAGDKIWVDLYLAQNTAPAANAPVAPAQLHDRLVSVFGYKHYELVKSEQIELAHQWEQWAVPRKDFFIRVEPLPRQPDKPQTVAWELYKDGFLVVKGHYEAHKETPLFINGPEYKQGRFIFVLEER